MELFTSVTGDGAVSRELVTYAHFCEIMPEARKKHYTITRRPGGFDLHLPNQSFADAETRDVLLSELSLGFEAKDSPRVTMRYGLLSGRIEAIWPGQRGFGSRLHTEVLAELYEHAYSQLVEPPILNDQGFREAVGCGQEEFLRFRAAMLALARHCHQMSAWHRTAIRQGDTSNATINEYGEWVSVCWKKDFFYFMIGQMAGLIPEVTSGLLARYSVDCRTAQREVKHARDGFFPPLWLLDDFVFFSPDALGRFVSSRNLAFVLNQLEEDRFAAVISGHLEPQLVQTGLDLLSGIGGLESRPSFNWVSGRKKGEVDLLVYFPEANVAWHVQAKGAIPPQGARMIRALEDRVKEAVAQLKSFRELSTEEKERIIAQELGRDVRGVRIVDVVFLRSCAGTDRVWQLRGDAVYITLPLLAELARRAKTTGSIGPLVDCGASVEQFMQDLIRAANPHWEQGSITLCGEEIKIPLLKFDHAVIARTQREVWEGASVGGGKGTPWKVVAPPGSNIVVVPAGTLPPRPKTIVDEILHALRLIDQNPVWTAEDLARATGMGAETLRKHPVVGAVLDSLEKYRHAKAEKREAEVAPPASSRPANVALQMGSEPLSPAPTRGRMKMKTKVEDIPFTDLAEGTNTSRTYRNSPGEADTDGGRKE